MDSVNLARWCIFNRIRDSVSDMLIFHTDTLKSSYSPSAQNRSTSPRITEHKATPPSAQIYFALFWPVSELHWKEGRSCPLAEEIPTFGIVMMQWEHCPTQKTLRGVTKKGLRGPELNEKSLYLPKFLPSTSRQHVQVFKWFIKPNIMIWGTL